MVRLPSRPGAARVFNGHEPSASYFLIPSVLVREMSSRAGRLLRSHLRLQEGPECPVNLNLQAAVVFDKAHFPEPIHEVTHSGAGSPDHLGESFLAHLWNRGLRT